MHHVLVDAVRSVRSVVAGLCVALGLLWAPPALAAFPGSDGMLAVQPQSGGGVLLVRANGQVVHRICTVRKRCGTPRRPRWSPDGRAIVFAGPAIRIVYTDGSCLDCQFGAAPDPAFRAGGATISVIERGRVVVDGIDTVRKDIAGVGGVSDAVWSAGGWLAVVRRGALWAGRPGRLHAIGKGSQPSWAPSGDRIAAAQAGWVVIVDVAGHHVRRLARGSAPAFSPDGRWIAFVAPGHRLMIVAAGGGRPRAVGHLKGLSVDWQPKPLGPNPGCAAPPGSTVLAAAPDAILTQDGVAKPPFGFELAPPVAYMGCLRADGRERLLEVFTGNSVDGASWVKSAILAAPYAALVAHSEDEHYGGCSDTVQVFDLRTGQLRKDLGGESASCGGPITDLTQVVLGSDGVSAARFYMLAPPGLLSIPFEAAGCVPASTFCLAAALGGDFFTSDDPVAGVGSWSRGEVAASQGGLTTVACPAESLCVGVGADIYTSSDPSGGASTWQPTALTGRAGDEIACPTTTLCVETRGDGTIATSRNPTGGSAAWRSARIDPSQALDGVVCSAEPRCFMTGSTGTVFTSGHPTGGPGAWAKSRSTPAFTSGACLTASLCVTVGSGGIATTTAPDSAVWTRQSISDSLVGVSCPSSSLCVAVGSGGALYVSTDPASGTWSHTIIDDGHDLSSVSCASASLCVATDRVGHVVTATNPTGGPSAWTPTLLDGDPCTDGHACSIESIKASDKSGLHTVDSSKLPGSGPFLTDIALNGDTLTWSHDGSPRAVQLTPP